LAPSYAPADKKTKLGGLLSFIKLIKTIHIRDVAHVAVAHRHVGACHAIDHSMINSSTNVT